MIHDFTGLRTPDRLPADSRARRPFVTTPAAGRYGSPGHVRISGASSEMPPPVRFILAVAAAIWSTKLASIMMFTCGVGQGGPKNGPAMLVGILMDLLERLGQGRP